MSSTRNALDLDTFNVHMGLVLSPGVGQHQTISPVANTRSLLVVASFTLDTDANVGDRQISIRIFNNPWSLHIGQSEVVQPANTSYHYIVGIHLNASTVAVANRVTIPISPEAYILEPWTWKFNINNKELGDLFSHFTVYQKVWTYEQ